MDIEVVRGDLARTRTVGTADVPAEPGDGHVVFRIESFALTANNVTYGAVGDLVGYWNFYPARDDGWGRIPAWGHAAVVTSRAEGVTAGDRFFGFWPMSTHAIVQPGSVGPTGFTDTTPHRLRLPAIYNRYQRAATGPDIDRHAEALTALLRPLFATSFLIDAWLADEGVFGATTVVITSASSKTALGLAHLLSTHKRATVVGLTSEGHAEFVAATGAYDRVVTYDTVADVGGGTAVLVDFAGNPDVVAAVHHHYVDRLQRSIRVGFTHRGEGAVAELPGPAPEFFFAPDHITRRSAEWGGDGLAGRIDTARREFDATAGTTIEIVERAGTDAILDAWTTAVDGGLDPRQGIICRW